jgi:hypothetical protein
MKKYLILFVIGIAVITGCNTNTNQTDAGATETNSTPSGVEGQIVLATCYGDQIGQDCHLPVKYQATIVVIDQQDIEVARVESDEDGYFRIELSPGLYTLQPTSGYIYPMAVYQEFVVVENILTWLDVVFDSGDR